MYSEEKIASLNILHGIINRMGNHSFLIKGWEITLVAGGFALSPQAHYMPLIILFISISFLLLDTTYLKIEKKYRRIFKDVCRRDKFFFDYSDENQSPKGEWFLNILFSKTIMLFHFPIILVSLCYNLMVYWDNIGSSLKTLIHYLCPQ